MATLKVWISSNFVEARLIDGDRVRNVIEFGGRGDEWKIMHITSEPFELDECYLMAQAKLFAMQALRYRMAMAEDETGYIAPFVTTTELSPWTSAE